LAFLQSVTESFGGERFGERIGYTSGGGEIFGTVVRRMDERFAAFSLAALVIVSTSRVPKLTERR